MTALTKLSHTDIDSALAPFGVGPCNRYSLLSGGSENTNYKVDCESASYVLTICEQKSLAASRELVQLLDFLNANGFATSRAQHTTAGDEVGVWQGKAVMLKSYIAGQIIEDFSCTLLDNLGAQLALLHQLPPPGYLSQQVGFGIEQFGSIAAYAPDCDFAHWLREITAFLTPYLALPLPKALIHSDLFYNNTVVDSAAERVTVMDFEEACHYFRVFDLGMTLVGTCCSDGQFSLEKAAALVRSYCRSNTLLGAERDALQAFSVYAAAATAYWRHQNYHHVNPDPAMFEHYRAMQDVANQIRQIDPQTFKTALF